MHKEKIDRSCHEEIILAAVLASQTPCSRRWQVSEVGDSTVVESDCPYRIDELWRNIRPVERSIVVRSAVAWGCFVTQINPRFTGATTDVRWKVLVGCAPSQPHRVHRHT